MRLDQPWSADPQSIRRTQVPRIRGTDDHADVPRFEAHQGALQRLATKAETGGQRPRSAAEGKA
jgi:hypothetical protein